MQILGRVAGLCSPSEPAPPPKSAAVPSWAMANNVRADLPPDWTAHVHRATGRTFYRDHARKTTTWTHPTGAVYTPGVPRPWERVVDTKSGRYYYINHDTHATSWDPPAGVEGHVEWAPEEQLRGLDVEAGLLGSNNGEGEKPAAGNGKGE